MANIKPIRLIGPGVIALGVVLMVVEITGLFETSTVFEFLGPWLFVIGLVLVVLGVMLTLIFRDRLAPNLIGNRWAGPMLVVSGLVGLVWLVLFYAFSGSSASLPVIDELGNWNMAVGMGFIIAAFGFATKWE